MEHVLTARTKSYEEHYCELYRIEPKFHTILKQIPKNMWYVFNGHKVIETAGERYTEICTGYYSGVGQQAKRNDLTPFIKSAVKGAGFRFLHYNNHPREGVTGNRIKIWY